MPNDFAIAIAVILWSPVIITVLIPASLHFATASFTSSLGGSIIPHIPVKINSPSIFSISSLVGLFSTYLYAIPNTLRAFPANSSFALCIFFISSFVISLISPFIEILLQISRSSSTPPFVHTIYLSSYLLTVVISFLSESNGISETLLNLSSSSFLCPQFKAKLVSAVSVGSPVNSSFETIFVSLQSNPIRTVLLSSSSLFTASTDFIFPFAKSF